MAAKWLRSLDTNSSFMYLIQNFIDRDSKKALPFLDEILNSRPQSDGRTQ